MANVNYCSLGSFNTRRRTYTDGTTPKICIIGAGFSGLLAGLKVKSKLRIEDFVIFDENEDVGGVWLANTYPGCSSDAPSHLYSYACDPNPYWTENYASQAEILEYLQNIAKKYDLYRNIIFKSQVKDVIWDETFSQWRIRVYNKLHQRMDEHFFNIVINSPGALRLPNVPEQFRSFKGPIIHSAQWANQNIDFENKVVGIVGNGASAVQLIPQLATRVKELHSYQRKPAWVMPKRNFKFPTFIQWLFYYIPFIMMIFRWILFWSMEIFYPALINGTWIRWVAKWYSKRHLKNEIGNDDKLLKVLTPKHALGCNRIIVSNDYLATMRRQNVKVHTDIITAVNETSIHTETGGQQEIDILVLATGYLVQNYFAPMRIIGKNGEDVLNTWMTKRPIGYLGIVTTSAPNQFGILGPHTGLGHNSVIFMVECQVNYTCQIIEEMMLQDARVFELKKSTEDEEMKLLDIQMKKMVWGNLDSTCGSWYANSRGINTTIWPWSCVNYWWRTRKPDFTKFHFLETLQNNNFIVI